MWPSLGDQPEKLRRKFRCQVCKRAGNLVSASLGSGKLRLKYNLDMESEIMHTVLRNIADIFRI